MLYPYPNTSDSQVQFREKYDNYINGEWVAPADGEYFENTSPVDGKVICQVARSKSADIEKALDAAHAAKDAWGKTSVTERANILLKIADSIEANLESIA
ncbi:MAG: aldehyde dehydrogenase family protein, partial [Moraxellaceae bacterium]